jgi:splicing factor U2AF subunit
MWQNPLAIVATMGGDPASVDPNKLQDDFNDFYEEIYEEMKQFGTLEDIQVCENLGDHMVGNVYFKFEDEEEAEAALQKLSGRYYGGRMLTCEYSPVTDFREARCRQFDEGTCGRGGFCNFMHVREPSRELRKHLEKVNGTLNTVFV